MSSALDLAGLGGQDAAAVAVAHLDGPDITYGELRSRVARCREALKWPAKALAVVDAPRSLNGLLGYLAAHSSGHAVLLVENGGPELWGDLIAAYQPELVITDPDAVAAELVRRAGYQPLADGPLPVCYRDGAPPPPIHPHLGLLARTSGSLGSPKTVRLSYRNLQTNATAIARALALRRTDRVMTALPMDFSFGLSLVNSAFAAGASVAVSTYSPSSKPFWDYLDRAAGTCVGAVRTTYASLRSRGWEPAAHPSLRLLLHTGGPLDEETLMYFADKMAAQGAFVPMYGQTEATARIACMPPSLTRAYPGSAGVAIPGGLITVVRPDGKTAADGETGEIVFSGPGVMMGYATTRAGLADPDRQGGVLHTGDLGYLRDGLVYVAGRLDRQVKIFGRRINLDEVERTLLTLGISAAAEAVGDERLLVAAEPAPDLASACRTVGRAAGLPPSSVRSKTVRTLPLNHHGKIDRGAVRRLLTEDS